MKRAADLLQSFFLKHGIDEGETYVSFFRKWETIVGRDLAAHADVEDIKNGALVVKIDHPAWMQILHMKKDTVVATINRLFPDLKIRSIHMYLSTESVRKPRDNEERPARPPDPLPTKRDDTEHPSDTGSRARLNEVLARLGEHVEERNHES